MCGIAGITDKELEKKEEVIRKMTEAIVHRGPDDDGFFTDQHASIGMRRLSIIDLGGGKQPISSFDERYRIVFNGEIYNYKELREELVAAGEKFKTESDTEVILRLFEKEGESSVTRLRGMFAFAIYDTQEKKVFLARDYFGIKPLYYLCGHSVSTEPKTQRVLAFSSEIKSLLSYPGFVPEVNDRAVFNYLSFQYNPLDETFFKNVFKLPPAHIMRIDLETGRAETERYWQFSFRPDESLDEKECKDEILETLKDSVKHHMVADVPVGSFLSGGIDSSIIATLMQEIRGDEKIKTFTVGFENLSEGTEARETAEPLGTDHKEIRIDRKEYFAALEKAVWHFDEPVADPSALGLYFLAREASKDVKVVLSGEGSDELFGGYNIYLEPFARRKIAWIPHSVLKFAIGLPFNFRGKNYAKRASRKLEDWYIGNASIFEPREADQLWKYAKQERLLLGNLYRQTEGLSDSAKMQYIDIHTWLVGDILAKADKMTMAHSLELRVPFLDIEVARLSSRLPDKFKWRGHTTKYLLREAFRSILPESTRQRKKLGFPTPVRDWFKDRNSELFKTILDNPYIASRMDAAAIENLIDEHVGDKKDNSRKIYLLLMLAIWYNTFKPSFSK